MIHTVTLPHNDGFILCLRRTLAEISTVWLVKDLGFFEDIVMRWSSKNRGFWGCRLLRQVKWLGDWCFSPRRVIELTWINGTSLLRLNTSFKASFFMTLSPKWLKQIKSYIMILHSFIGLPVATSFIKFATKLTPTRINQSLLPSILLEFAAPCAIVGNPSYFYRTSNVCNVLYIYISLYYSIFINI